MKLVCIKFDTINALIHAVNSEKIADAVINVVCGAYACVFVRVSDQRAKHLVQTYNCVDETLTKTVLSIPVTAVQTAEEASRFAAAA